MTCERCKGPAVSRSRFCWNHLKIYRREGHTARTRKVREKLAERLTTHGICAFTLKCTTPAEEDRSYCRAHLDQAALGNRKRASQNAETSKNWRKRRRAAKLCMNCNSPAVTKDRCERHREEHNLLQRALRAVGRIKKPPAGTCVSCGQPAVTKSRCEAHRQQMNQAAREKRLEKRIEKIAAVGAREMETLLRAA